jgi:hypothetical protein
MSAAETLGLLASLDAERFVLGSILLYTEPGEKKSTRRHE